MRLDTQFTRLGLERPSLQFHVRQNDSLIIVLSALDNVLLRVSFYEIRRRLLVATVLQEAGYSLCRKVSSNRQRLVQQYLPERPEALYTLL